MSSRNRQIGYHNMRARIPCPHVDRDKIREFKKFVCEVLTILDGSIEVEKIVSDTRMKMTVNTIQHRQPLISELIIPIRMGIRKTSALPF